jgi:hypothetical protein
MMIAVPRAAVVQSYDQEVAALEPVQTRARVAIGCAPSHNLLTEGYTKVVQEGGLHQKGQNIRRLARQQLIGEIVADVRIRLR